MISKLYRGYTLIEVVVALAIFSILATLSIGLLSRTFDVKAQMSHTLTSLNHLELSIARIRHDVHQLVNRPVRDEHMNKLSAFSASSKSVYFTRGGFISQKNTINPTGLRRVALICQDNQLIRATWPVLDGVDVEHPYEQILVDDLNACHFSFFDGRKWIDHWDGEASSFPPVFKFHFKLSSTAGEFIFVIPGRVGES